MGTAVAANFHNPRMTTSPLKKWQAAAIALFTLLGLVFIWSVMLHSPGATYDDEVGHLVICRDAWQHPVLILDVWGRMLFTLLYMIPVKIGWGAARVFSVFLATGTVLITTALSRKIGLRYFWVIPLFLWFQPFYSSLSFSTLTEVPFSALFVGAGWLFASRRYSAAAFCVGLLPLIRYEGAALLGVVFLLCLTQRTWRPMLFGLLPLLIQNGITFLVLGRLPFEMFLHPTERWLTGQSAAVGTMVTTFGFSYRFRLLPELIGLPLLILVILGLPHLFKRKEQVVVFGCYLLYFSIHVVITWLSLFGEREGTVRYMLPLAPGLAMIAAVGLHATVRALSGAARRFAGRRAMLAVQVALISICALVVWIIGARNFTLYGITAHQSAMHQAADWVRTHETSGNSPLSTNVWFYYLLPKEVDARDLWLQTGDLRSVPAGTLAVWDVKYSNLYGLPLSELQSSSWKQVFAIHQPLSGNPNGYFDVNIFQKLANTGSAADAP
jgi:hypothetical protein